MTNGITNNSKIMAKCSANFRKSYKFLIKIKNNMQNLIIKNILILTLLVFSTSFALNDSPEPWHLVKILDTIMEGIISIITLCF